MKGLFEMKQGENQTRREFLKTSALAGAGAALAVSGASAWAAPQAKSKLNLRVRQDLIPDFIMDGYLKRYNAKNKDVRVASSFVDSNHGWGYEVEHCHEAPAWYTQGEPCQIFMGRGPALAQLADAGTIIPLDEFIDKSTDLPRDDFHTSRYGCVLDSTTYRGSLWGIPIIADTYALFCNMDLFGAAGLSVTPDNWEDAISMARAMTRDTNGDGAPDVFGYSQCSFQFPLQILSAGLDLVDVANKRVLFDSDAGLEALDTYRRLSANSPPHTDFEKGDMGMKISVCTNAHGRYKHINHITTPLPAGARRANSYGDSDGAVAMAISAAATPDERAAAWRFIEYIASAPMFFELTNAARMLPLRKSILSSDKYAEYLEKYPIKKAFIQELEYAVPKPCIPEYRYIEVIMRDILYVVQKADNRMDVTREAMLEHLKAKTELVNQRLAKATW
jgi:ABC-type glycerol-3-phosphate transport system substrate-binding protein